MIIDRGEIVAEGTPSQLAARSRFHGAVTLTLDTHCKAQAGEALAALANTHIEVTTRGDETSLHIFADQGGLEPTALLAQVRACMSKNAIAPRALALETGRLDDVFGELTRKARPLAPRFEEAKR